MTGQDIFDYLPLAVLYAETHYRFRCLPLSLYYRRRPEVVFDAPHRLEPGQPLPVTLIIKDAHRFPVKLSEVNLQARHKDSAATKQIALNLQITEPFWHRIFELDVSELPPGPLTVDAEAHVQLGRRRETVHQDNYPGLSHSPLRVFKAADQLPTLPGWKTGELHCHTAFGCDQVEFSAPLEAYQRTAPALGLDWIALTDHSYNLDDYEDDYLRDDPDLTKWHRFQQDVAELNRSFPDVLLIPGEELTCQSARGRNVHLLVLGEPDFLPGSGDGAQKWLHFRSELSVEDALNRLNLPAFAAAAHPFTPIGFLERLLVNRGRWEESDLNNQRLDGWQIFNGAGGVGWRRDLDIWTAALGKGERQYIYAGNDAHGNFNRFRQIGLPMMRLIEHHHHLFGRQTTRAMVEGALTVQNLLAALKDGRASVSEGPIVELTALQNGRELHTGSEVSLRKESRAVVRYATAPEFGRIHGLRLLTSGEEGERPLRQFSVGSGELPDPYRGEVTIPLEGRLYLRADLTARTPTGDEHHAHSNPLWLTV